jgi:hypothetical protein
LREADATHAELITDGIMKPTRRETRTAATATICCSVEHGALLLRDGRGGGGGGGGVSQVLNETEGAS